MPDKFGPVTPAQKAARLAAIFAEAESIVQSVGSEWLVPFVASRFLPYVGTVAMMMQADDVLAVIVKTITDPANANESVSTRQLAVEDMLIAHGPDNDPVDGNAPFLSDDPEPDTEPDTEPDVEPVAEITTGAPGRTLGGDG